MSISSLSLLLTEGLEVGGGDTAGLVGVKAGIPNGSTLDWEGPGEENGLADTDLLEDGVWGCDLELRGGGDNRPSLAGVVGVDPLLVLELPLVCTGLSSKIKFSNLRPTDGWGANWQSETPYNYSKSQLQQNLIIKWIYTNSEISFIPQS